MIYIWMKGGLGNQLFQYAFGRHLSDITGQKLVLDLRVYQARQLGGAKQHETFGLSRLRLSDCFITSPMHALAARTLNKVMARIPPLTSFAIWITDRTPEADRVSVPHQKKIVFVDGYFQGSLYAQEVRKTLLREFVPRDEPTKAEAEAQIGRRRGERPVIAMHVRRGDFLGADSPTVALPVDYFHRAMQRYSGCTVLVYSDDPTWSQAQFSGPNIHIMPRGDAVQDLYAMSLADHNIISNSTFSWWAAWLNQNQGCTVIAPEIWLKPEQSLVHPRDFLPPSWIILNSHGDQVHRPLAQDGVLAADSGVLTAQSART